MALELKFRVVGVYFYKKIAFDELGISETNTVKEVQDAVATNLNGRLELIESKNNPPNLTEISFDFQDDDETPPNSATEIQKGTRTITENIVANGPSQVLQYSRSVDVKTNQDTILRVKAVFDGQPNYGQTPLNKDLEDINNQIPQDWEIISYNLTWRLVEVNLNPSALEKRLKLLGIRN